MPELPAAPFRGCRKWGPVAANLAIAALGAVLTSVVFVAIPPDVAVLRVLGWYTGFATVATLVLALALATTRQLPLIAEARLDGQAAAVLRAWRGEWWYDLAIDLGLVVATAVVAVLGVAAGGGWAVGGVVVGALGAWLAVRVGLRLTGRLPAEALWITGDEAVVESAWGRERCDRRQVERVRRHGSRGVQLVLEASQRAQPVPLPWRGRRRGRPGLMFFDCSRTGHDAADVAAWLQEQAGRTQVGA